MDSANAASAVSPRKASSLKQRILSAVVLAPLVVGLVWWSLWTLVALVTVATVIATVELYGAFAHGGYRAQTRVGVLLAIAPVLAAALEALTDTSLILPALILAVPVSLVAALNRHAEQGALAGWALTVVGALY
ncbi:MAG: hypothetical protein RLZZ387_4254, partial [Chloroflexota bacterium]